MIEVKHLTKFYGDHAAIRDLNFTIEDGRIYGFLGPNAAGKSTTMNIMTGCLAATSGTVTVDGYDIFDSPKEAKKRIGYLPEIPPVYTDRTPYEYLRFVAEAKGVPSGEIRQQIADAMEVTDITSMKDRLIANLSKGYRQRVGIAQALLGNPEVIILDEPTVGLDPLQIIEIRELIKKLGRDRTVILSSHILSEVQAVCDTILIINTGTLIACETEKSLREKYGDKSLEDIFISILTPKASQPEEEAEALPEAEPKEKAGPAEKTEPAPEAEAAAEPDTEPESEPEPEKKGGDEDESGLQA